MAKGSTTNNWFRNLLKRTFRKESEFKMVSSNMLTCREVTELVTDYLEEALLPEKHSQFEEHLSQCVGCTHYVEQVRKTIGMLHELAQQPMFPETKEELRQIFQEWKKNS